MQIVGHEKQWEFLKQSAELNKSPHAYLFSGQEKLGKRTLALEWASLIFNKDLQKSPHPDLILIEPRNREIQIAQIRNLSWKLSLRPYSAPFKIAIIDQAHLMNQEAQTSLLKTLEEPRGKTFLILISNYPEILFPLFFLEFRLLNFILLKKKKLKII